MSGELAADAADADDAVPDRAVAEPDRAGTQPELDNAAGAGAGAGADDVARARAAAAWPPRNIYGERAVVLVDDPRGIVGRSVQTLADLPDDLPRHALVGGLAVMVRLYEAHRVTTDFDEVSQGRDLAIARLLADGAVRTSNGVAMPDRGVRLDLLDAELDLASLESFGADELTGDAERRAVQLAMVCRYALDTAVLTDIIVASASSRATPTADGVAPTGEVEVVSRVKLPVALAGALVAMKAHAAVAPDRAPGKAAADVFDTWRLVRAWGARVVADDLSHAPVVMVRTVQSELRRLFVDDVDRTARWLASTSVPGVASVDADDLESVGLVADLLEPFTHWD